MMLIHMLHFHERCVISYGGLIPIDGVNSNGDVNLMKRYRIYDHEKEGIKGLISIVGVKYTEGRHVAQKTIDLVYKKLGINSSKCITMDTPVQGGLIERFNDFLENAIEKRPQELNEETVKQLVYNYGSEYPKIIKYINEDSTYAKRVSSISHVIKAEILFNIREEMAQKLADIVMRRTELGTAEYPGEEALKNCANIMAQELGWDGSRVQMEIEEVKKIYRGLNESFCNRWTGFTGGHLVKRLVKEGHEVSALARKTSNTESLEKLE